MKLRLLVLEGELFLPKYNKLNHILIPVNVMKQSHHIKEIFMYFLPKIELDGSSKLTIYFKEKPKDKKKYDCFCTRHVHVSWYYVDENDILNLKKLNMDKEDLEDCYLNIIADTLKYIAKENHCEQKISTIIEETIQKVKDSEYKLTQKIKKLSRVSLDKCFRASVYRHLDSQGEIWFVEIQDKNKKVNRYDIMEKPTHISKLNVYEKSKWEEGKFLLLDRFDRVVTEVKVN